MKRKLVGVCLACGMHLVLAYHMVQLLTFGKGTVLRNVSIFIEKSGKVKSVGIFNLFNSKHGQSEILFMFCNSFFFMPQININKKLLCSFYFLHSNDF